MKFMCGTPQNECTGSYASKESHSSGHKLHSSAEDARKCTIKYYRNQGYTSVGNILVKDGFPNIVFPKRMG